MPFSPRGIEQSLVLPPRWPLILYRELSILLFVKRVLMILRKCTRHAQYRFGIQFSLKSMFSMLYPCIQAGDFMLNLLGWIQASEKQESGLFLTTMPLWLKPTFWQSRTEGKYCTSRLFQHEQLKFLLLCIYYAIT